MSWHVGMGGFWLGHLAISDDESFAGTFSRRHRWVFVGPCHLCVHGPPAFTLWFRVSHTQQAARARFPNQKMVRNQVCCFHGVVLWHGTWCSNVRDVALLTPTETQGSFTAFSSISTEEGRQKQTTASDFSAVRQATNDRQKRLVTAWCCFSQSTRSWHGTWCSNLCVHGPWVSWMRCGIFLAPTKTKGSFTAFRSISTEEGWQKQTTASESLAVQQATNDRQKKGW